MNEIKKEIWMKEVDIKCTDFGLIENYYDEKFLSYLDEWKADNSSMSSDLLRLIDTRFQKNIDIIESNSNADTKFESNQETLAETLSSNCAKVPIISPPSPFPLVFAIIGKHNRARVGILKVASGYILTPVFMPVATKGAIKGLNSNQIYSTGCRIILTNTYHMALSPTEDVLRKVGGIKRLMNWSEPMLTDSGGFQMVSLFDLMSPVSEMGVVFKSPFSDSETLITPEISVRIQNAIGADIIMALDDVVSASCSNRSRFEEATFRTTRWLKRCVDANENKTTQNVFGIVQGGVFPDLRSISLTDLKNMKLSGYAIGGLCGGEDKDSFWRTIDLCSDSFECSDGFSKSAKGLPYDRPRYVMGVGYLEDILVCVALGCDMFDCVYPSRTARFGTAITYSGLLKLKHKQYENDLLPIDSDCACYTCQTCSRSLLHSVAGKTTAACQLITLHNIHFYMELCSDIRTAIMNNVFDIYVRQVLYRFYNGPTWPAWIDAAMSAAGIYICRETF